MSFKKFKALGLLLVAPALLLASCGKKNSSSASTSVAPAPSSSVASSATPSVDTNEYWLVGRGSSSDLPGWEFTKESAKMTKVADNTYTKTFDLYKGDQFKFAVAGWSPAFGWSELETAEANSVVCFADAHDSNNISVEKSGTYTFTLTTVVSGSSITGSLTWTLDAELSDVKLTYNIYGENITNWKLLPIAETTFQETEEEGVYSLTVWLKENENFLFCTNNQATWIKYGALDDESKELFVDADDDSNIVTKESGYYTFVLDLTSGSPVISVTVDSETAAPSKDIYIKGAFNGWADLTLELEQNKLNPSIYTITGVEAHEGDAWGISAWEKGYEAPEEGELDWSKNSFYGWSYVVSSPSADPAVVQDGSNVAFAKDGIYDVYFNFYAKIIEVDYVRPLSAGSGATSGTVDAPSAE